MAPDPALVARFKVDLQGLTQGRPEKLGVAVSGGPDSLALLLLAAAAYPGAVVAATVDHGLREESAGEARFVARICDDLGVPHAVLAPGWSEAPASNVPALARRARYEALRAWSGRAGCEWIATAHHVDDQAETLLMRLARGSGVAGLAGVRAVNAWPATKSDVVVRPLLGWRKAELVAIVEAAGLQAVVDPTNDDDRLDRTHARRLLDSAPWLNPVRIAASATNLLDAEEALAWTTERVVEARLRRAEDQACVTIDARDLPRELQRRLLRCALANFTDETAVPGPKLMTLLDTLLDGRPATLAGVKAEPGDTWRLTLAPPRRT
ncbi:tRNA lysidine(34) synthetase TilS [Sphingosinicella sp. YJ22]|uniref:tRNA lysidine(34) synthetase TilS n=1 Tax=Sphingosinicella sp. YJ22 TaxID=1104780 RepID=UPI00140A6D65|nr:tRNA lysidine(34) synthetase TilS [Sphingosinicella sp. YJ22]